VLYVVKPGKTRAVNAVTPLEEFNRVGAKLIGVVMNRIPRSREYYYGGYGYYSLDSGKEQKYYRSEESVDLGDLQPEKSEDPLKS
jgi:Mrp family chromosome partitioning ATPase